MGLSIVPVFADPNPELERLRAELAAAKERAEKAETQHYWSSHSASALRDRVEAAEAKAEGLAKALRYLHDHVHSFGTFTLDDDEVNLLNEWDDQIVPALVGARKTLGGGHE
jgi:hypothetical protein